MEEALGVPPPPDVAAQLKELLDMLTNTVSLTDDAFRDGWADLRLKTAVSAALYEEQVLIGYIDGSAGKAPDMYFRVARVRSLCGTLDRFYRMALEREAERNTNELTVIS